MAEPTTGRGVITLDGGERFDAFREALAALELASLRPVDEQQLAVVREVIAALRNRMAEVRDEPLPEIPAAPRLDVFARAEEAGEFRQLREQALRPDSPDPQVAALRAAAALLGTGDAPSPTPQPEKPVKIEELSRAEQIVQRLSTTAVDDDGYRVQLIDLAATSGGLYEEALDRVYEIETETLGQAEATARLLLDCRQLVATRERDRRRAARAQLEAAGAAQAQTVRNLVASATADAGFREQLTELARERGGVFAEALAALGKG